MRAFLRILIVLALVVPPAMQADELLTVTTYNIRRIVDQPHERWEDRRPAMVACIRAMAPDVLGTQEGLYPQIRDLENDLPEFRWIGLARDGGSDDEFCAIFFRHARVEPLAFGHFWLSDTPHVMGSITWGTQFRRMCTWARFRDRRGGGEFVVFNTHFDHEVQDARERSAALIRERVRAVGDDVPVLVLGDFNARAGENPAYHILLRDGLLSDTWLTAGETRMPPETGSATFNGWGEFPLGDARIDWILARGPWSVRSAEIVGFTRAGRFPSDHLPVVARLQIQP